MISFHYVLIFAASLFAIVDEGSQSYSQDDVQIAIQTFLAKNNDAQEIGFIRISGEGLAKKKVVAVPETSLVTYGPYQVDLASGKVTLASVPAVMFGKIVRTKSGLMVQIDRIIWNKR